MKRSRITDHDLTTARKVSGEYKDHRSHVLLDGREILFGKDITRRRREVWERDMRSCVKCGKHMTFEQFEMAHTMRKSLARDDRAENLSVKCGPFDTGCHRGSKHADHK